jgi:hypothetical protein
MTKGALLRLAVMVSTLTATVLNRRAAAYLKKARLEFGEEQRGKEFSQKEFAGLLALKLGPWFTAGMLRTYEARTRHVPAAVLLAAAELTGIPISLERSTEDALVDRVVHRLREAGISAG